MSQVVIPIYDGMRVQNEYGERIYNSKRGAFCDNNGNMRWINSYDDLVKDAQYYFPHSSVFLWYSNMWVDIKDFISGKLTYIPPKEQVDMKSSDEYLKLFPIKRGTVIESNDSKYMILYNDTHGWEYITANGFSTSVAEKRLNNPRKFWNMFGGEESSLKIDGVVYQKPRWNEVVIDGITFHKKGKEYIATLEGQKINFTHETLLTLGKIIDVFHHPIVIGCKSFSKSDIENIQELVD